MEKKTNPTLKINKQIFTNYINNQFAEFKVPPLQQFLEIKHVSGAEILTKPFQAGPNIPLSPEIQNELESEAVVYVHTGIIELYRWEGKGWRKQMECKDGNFFSIVNYKNMLNLEPEFYKVNFKSNSTFSLFLVNQNYAYSWMRKNWFKNIVLSKVFFYGDSGLQIQRKKAKFRDFIDKFQYEVFRRESKLVSQGQTNSKLYIIAKGEAKITKELRLGKQKGESSKNVDVLYLREGSVIGGELFMMNSKIVNTIISHHIPSPQLIKKRDDDEEEEEKQVKGKHKMKNQFNFKQLTIEDGGYQLYNPHQNLSNFNVIAESANLEVFYIDLNKIVSVISERSKSNITKLIEQTYVTILRRIHEKMTAQLEKEQSQQKRKHQMFDIITAKYFTQEPSEQKSVSSSRVQVKKSQIGILTKKMGELKNSAVLKKQRPSLTARTGLAMEEKQPKHDFKEKIEKLLEAKLQASSEASSAYKQELVVGLSEIFMKNNEGRSEDIEMRSGLLERKCKILEKRGGWKPGWNCLKQQGIQIPEQKSKICPNYLNGVNMNEYTSQMKEKCVSKIHQTNKIKEQFMKIKSECPSCTCYEHFQSFSTGRKSLSNMGRTGYKTAEGWGRTSRVSLEGQPLQSVYNKRKFINEKIIERYNHNIHLLQVRKNRSQLQRRKSAPILLKYA